MRTKLTTWLTIIALALIGLLGVIWFMRTQVFASTAAAVLAYLTK